MASGLAMSVLQSAEAALAPAIFGPWMNISGAILAAYWRRKPIIQNPTDFAAAELERVAPRAPLGPTNLP
jgi:predicted Na+-dependent transporter